MHRAHVGKAAARVDYRELRAGLALEEEQTRITLGGIRRFFGVGVDIVKDRIARRRAFAHVVDNFDGLVRVDIIVPRKRQIAERAPAVVTCIDGKDQPAVTVKNGIVYHVVYRRVRRIFHSGFRGPGALKREKQRQSVIQIFLHGVKIVITALLQIENVMLGRKDLPCQHFIRHVDRLALDRVLRADGVIDEIAALVKMVVFHKLFNEIDVPFDLEVAVGAVVPAGTAHGQEVMNIVVVIAELQPCRHRTEGEAAERPVIAGGHQVLRRSRFSIGMEHTLDRRHQMILEIPVELPEFRNGA